MKSCLSLDELAALALGQSGDVPSHVEACAHCREKLEHLRQVAARLLATHTILNQDHEASRAQLLASLANFEPAASRASVWSRFTRGIATLTPVQRIAAGGLGLSTAVGLIVLALLFANSATQLSAMERMAKQLREVTSFSFELQETSQRTTGENRRTILRNDTNFWRAPAYWHGTTQMAKVTLPPTPAEAEVLSRIEEIYTPGQRGILIDHTKKTFFRTPEMKPDSFPDYSPVNWIQRIMSKGSVKVIDELGTKQLQRKTARGYIVSLGHPDPNSAVNTVEMWLDSETDLPIEFSIVESSESGDVDPWADSIRAFNCRWNIDIDPEFFQPKEPAGYDDTSWPRNDQEVEGMVRALALYAQLSDGHYPRVAEFRSNEVQQEMFKLAESKQSLLSAEEREQLNQQIQQAKTGLDTIARVLRNKHHTGYYAAQVTASDQEKCLLWWPVDIEDSYQVIYGNLRTEILPLAKWSKLVPAEMAKMHAPVKYAKPESSR